MSRFTRAGQEPTPHRFAGYPLTSLAGLLALVACSGSNAERARALDTASETESPAAMSGSSGASGTSGSAERPAATSEGSPGSLPLDGSAAGFVENGGAACAVPVLPGMAELADVAALPDPFTSLDSTRITTKAAWACRRAEISAQVQQYELGPKPAAPSLVSGQFADGTLTITAGEPAQTVSFTVPIARPAGAADGPIPAIIEIGGNSLDTTVFDERGIARIKFDNNAMGAQNGGGSRGTGTFYDLYGAAHEAGSMMAWAWGVSRIIDALEATPDANIDPTRIAVTGCSRNGKGALVVGAFDERIALTIPQESGAGGSAAWRISQVQEDAILAANPSATTDDQVQTLSEAQGEQPWFRANFSQFSRAVTRLPYDHHMLLGMVAPRALLVIDNTSMNWLGNESSFTDSVAASQIWTALGKAGTMGASQIGNHNHCAFPASQRGALVAFVDKFLVGTATASTDVIESDGIDPDLARWTPYSVPELE
jgi:hypothetical protein